MKITIGVSVLFPFTYFLLSLFLASPENKLQLSDIQNKTRAPQDLLIISCPLKNEELPWSDYDYTTECKPIAPLNSNSPSLHKL